MNNLISSPAAIKVTNLGHSFKNHVALADISFRVQPQDLHGFVGPNGAGKTTTLKLICTLLQPQRGNVSVFGQNVVTNVKSTRRQIGFMPDHINLYRQLTVYEYLDFFGAAYGLSVRNRSRVISDILALTDMDGRKDDLINSLSRGMQQRVNLARVLVNDPDLLLLDEPASGLDPRARIELMEILRELRRLGKTILISSHILSELALLCDSVTIIDRGLVKYSGPMNELLSQDQDQQQTFRLSIPEEDPAAEKQLTGLPAVIAVEKIEGRPEYRISIDPAQSDANALLRNVLDVGLSVAAFSKDRKHLNQAFMDLTERGVR